jgi:hypothetical protein
MEILQELLRPLMLLISNEIVKDTSSKISTGVPPPKRYS